MNSKNVLVFVLELLAFILMALVWMMYPFFIDALLH